MDLPSDCRQNIVDAVKEEYGAEDETFEVVNVKVVYGGVFKGLSMPVVAIVRTSDEVDPRDVLVKTSAPENGLCAVEVIQTLSNALTIDDPELEWPE